MKLPLAPLVNLLHSTAHATLATHSTQLEGFPFASALPFAVDAEQRPLLLISRLAEHTRNLQADPRASMLVCAGADDVLSGARLTLLGEITPFAADAELLARYLRYLPDGERYLALGDFAFYRLQPQRARFIAGFGQMGWVEAESWHSLPQLPLAQEATLLAELQPALAADTQLLGLDCFGVDLQRHGQRQRLPFATPQAAGPALLAAAQDLLQTLHD